MKGSVSKRGKGVVQRRDQGREGKVLSPPLNPENPEKDSGSVKKKNKEKERSCELPVKHSSKEIHSTVKTLLGLVHTP